MWTRVSSSLYIELTKILRTAVRQVFGKQAQVKRCQTHKKRNVVEHIELPCSFRRVNFLKRIKPKNQIRYSQELKERVVRMVFEQEKEYSSRVGCY